MGQGGGTSVRRQPGDATLALLADDGMLAVLAELSRGPARPRDIESNAPGVTRRTALRRLQTLATDGYASLTVEDDPGVPSAEPRGPSRAPYALTELGRECLPKVLEAAAHCERRWCPPPSHASGGAGLWTIKLIADLPARSIVRALADAPLRQGELLAHLPLFARSTLLGRLKMLCSCDLLVREAHSGEVRYSLTDGARHLVVVALRAAYCEGRWAGVREGPLLAGADLPGLLHMLAPLARVDREMAGACRWRLDSPGADTHLTVRSGRIAALGVAPILAPDAHGVASAEIWGAALLSGDPSRILVTGDEALFDAIFRGLSAALLA
jgi:DNA-binding HxlR family transcriptional regulator